MTDFIVGIAQFAYLIFIFWSAFALWLVLLFDLPARERHWLRDHWWEKLIPDQEIDRDIKIATEWLLRVGIYLGLIYLIISVGHGLFDYSHLLDHSELDGPAYLRG